MADVRILAQKVLPPPGLPRRLALQASLVAIGWGVYLTGSVVFFRLYAGLSAIQIGIGFSIAGFLTLVGSLPLGHLADRIGGKRAWVLGSAAGALSFACYPLVDSFWSFVLVLGAQTLGVALNDAGRTVYAAAAVPREIRVRTLAFVRAYLNAGFTAGAGLGAAAIALDSRPGLLVLVLANAVGLTCNAVLVSRMPDARAEALPGTADRLQPQGAETQSAGTQSAGRAGPWGVLRDRPYMALTLVFGIMFLSEIIFNEIMPLWAVSMTDVPRPVLGALFAINTVMAVLLQVPASRGADGMAGAKRITRWAAVSTAVACPVLAFSGATHGWATVALLALAVVFLTGSELWQWSAQWYFHTDVPPPEQRGAYLGAGNTVNGVFKMIGPAAFTFLTIRTGGWGWWVIAAIFAVCALITRPIVSWVARTPRNGATLPLPEPVPEAS